MQGVGIISVHSSLNWEQLISIGIYVHSSRISAYDTKSSIFFLQSSIL